MHAIRTLQTEPLFLFVFLDQKPTPLQVNKNTPEKNEEII